MQRRSVVKMPDVEILERMGRPDRGMDKDSIQQYLSKGNRLKG